MRTYDLAGVLCLMVIALPAMAEDCAKSDYPKDGIVLQSTGGGPAEFRLKNPIQPLADDQKSKIDDKSIKVCWVTEQELLNATPCEKATIPSTPLPVVLGTCSVSADKPVDEFPATGFDPARLKTAQALVIRFTPTEPVQVSRYLRVQWKLKENATPIPSVESPLLYKVTTNAGAARLDEDSRYKLWLYTGYSFLRSSNDFSDSYPELRLKVETRLADERLAMRVHDPARYARIVAANKYCPAETGPATVTVDDKTKITGSDLLIVKTENGETRTTPVPPAGTCTGRPTFKILRLYGETGLTNVSPAATTADTVATVRTNQAFDGSFAIGYGRTLLVSPALPSDTNAFSFQVLYRLGITSLPKRTVTDGDNQPTTFPGEVRYGHYLGARVENEGGHFEGAYTEIGIGQSDQFTIKKLPRMRIDALLPVNDPGNLIRIAGRVQFDTARPFAKVKKNGLENSNQGEIRISLLFNFDLKELAHRLGVPESKNTP